MKRHGFAARGNARFGLALAALVAATAIPVTASGADRVVLGEEFSNTG